MHEFRAGQQGGDLVFRVKALQRLLGALGERADQLANVCPAQRYYAPIAAAVNRAVLDNLPAGTTSSCLDAGCGEGYYLRQLAAALPPEQHLSLLGLDISKWAVQAAARAEKQGGWVVGTNARLPILAQTLDCVLCLFGFPVYPEFARQCLSIAS